MATDMMEVNLPVSSNPWKDDNYVDNLVGDQTDTTTPQPKRQRDNNYSPDESLTVFNNGVLPSSSSSSVAPFKNNGDHPDWVSHYGWMGASIPPLRDPNHYKLLDGDKAAEYNSIRNRLHTMVKLSLGIGDMRNKVPPLRSDKEYTNQDTAADSFLLLMARLSLNDTPPEQRKDEAIRLLGVVSDMVKDCNDINAFFGGGGSSGGGGGGDLVVPSSTLSTGNINSTSDEELTESNTPELYFDEDNTPSVGSSSGSGSGANAAVPSSCTTSDAIIDSNDDLVLPVASCLEGNNSSIDDELVLASNSELRTTEEISSMDASPPITNSKVTPLTATPNNSNNEETPSHQSLQHNNGGGGAANTTAAVVPELSNSTTAATTTTQIVATKEYIRETVLDIDSVIDVKSYISNAAGAVTNNTYQPDEVEIIKQIQYINLWGFKKDVPMDVILDRISLAEQGYRFFKPGECKCNYMCICMFIMIC